MADDRKGSVEPAKEPPAPAMARLLEAESEAEEIVNRGQKDAEEIVAEAKRRAKEILDAASSPHEGAGVSQADTDLEKQKRLIMLDANRRIEAMRSTAAPRLVETVEKLVALLVAES